MRRRVCSTPAGPRLSLCLVSLCLLLGAGLAGCGDPEIELVDSIDLELDLNPFSGPSDALHLPYVRGTRVRLWVRGDDAEDDMRVVSRDGAAFVDDGRGYFRAERAGDALVEVVDGGGDVVRRRALPVRTPDRVEIRAHGPLLVDRPAEPLVGAKIVVGGTATFLVAYFEGARRLYGNGVLSIEAPPGVAARNQTSYLFEDREWLTITAFEPGQHTLRLFADGVPVGRFTVTAVGPEAIEAVALHHDGRPATDGVDRLVWAEAVDLDGETVHGVAFDWDVDGVESVGSGDLFRYEVARGVVSTLCARFGEVEGVTRIQADWGTVDSTNDVGCAVSRPGGSSGGAGPALLLAGLLIARRRRVTAAAP